jgi:hypothetical protein
VEIRRRLSAAAKLPDRRLLRSPFEVGLAVLSRLVSEMARPKTFKLLTPDSRLDSSEKRSREAIGKGILTI